MNAKTRIKVSRDALVERIKTNAAKAQASYDFEYAAYMKAEKGYVKQVVDFLTATAAKVRSGEIDAHGLLSGGYRTHLVDQAPEMPREPRQPQDVALAVAQLEMSTEEAITITAEDFAFYMKN